MLTPEAVTTVESDNSSPNVRKLNISVIIHFNVHQCRSQAHCMAYVLYNLRLINSAQKYRTTLLSMPHIMYKHVFDDVG